MTVMTVLFTMLVVVSCLLYLTAAVRHYAAHHKPTLDTRSAAGPAAIRVEPVPRRPVDSLKSQDFIPFHVQTRQTAAQ